MEGIEIRRQERVRYLDCLRIFATVAVIAIHVSSQKWGERDPWSGQQMITVVYRCCVTWPLNIFVMITGILFLDPDRPVDIRKLYSKNILRMATAFVFWAVIYAGYRLIIGGG